MRSIHFVEKRPMSTVLETHAHADDHVRLQPERIEEALLRLGLCLHLPVERTDLELADVPDEVWDTDELEPLLVCAGRVGIHLKEASFDDEEELLSCVHEGYPVVLIDDTGSFWICESLVGRRVEATRIAEQTVGVLLGRSDLRKLLAWQAGMRVLIAKKDLECDSLTAAAVSPADAHSHPHPTPLRRFLALLRLDARDIVTLSVFASVSGVLTLATPLAVESLVNVVSWGTQLQPLLVLAVMLLACLGLAGVLRVLQTIVVEVIQRRQVVRIVGDLAHRFPRANRQALQGTFPREMANRVFDIMTIQKATAVLLLDGIAIVLTTFLGLLLLAFYHPFLLGFDIVLLISMVSITWLLGRGGVQTAIEESIVKYRIAHWLQDVLASPAAFKVNGGEGLAIERANRLAGEYIAARERQFRVLIRQIAFAIGLQVLASTALLGLGGWLVIRGQLTLGQLVASELVVTMIVGAFAKAGKALEKFYDLMAGIDKVGHLLDLPVDPRHATAAIPDGPAEIRWSDLSFRGAASVSSIAAASIVPGTRVAVVGDDSAGRSLLLKYLAGLAKPDLGIAEVTGLEAEHAAVSGEGRVVGYAGQPEIFHATLRENVSLGRRGIGLTRVREVLQQTELWDAVLRLREGAQTMLQTDGFPLSRNESIKLSIARAIAGRPRLLLIDGLLDELDAKDRQAVWATIAASGAPWTLVVATNQQEVAALCDETVAVRHGG